MKIDWIDALRSAAANEKGPLVATLATVRTDAAGVYPDARSVVVRDVADTGDVTFTSDRRSGKENQISEISNSVMVCWFSSARLQFRINGTATILAIDDPKREEQWRKLSDAARGTFHWPTPGESRSDADVFEKTTNADAPVPDTFDVVVVHPTFVDTLDLNPHPHLRRQWRLLDGRWSAATVNP